MTTASLLFWAAALLVVYTFVGYPLLMAAWARWRPRPLRPQPWLPRVAVVVVMHNEAARARAKLASCLQQDYPADKLQVVVVSDGSNDDTAEQIRSLHSPRVRLLAFEERRGKAACLNDAVAACDEEVIVFTDARQALNPRAVSHLVETLSDPTVGAVSGELLFVPEGVREFGQGVDAYWRYEKSIRRSEASVHSVPGATGALYALRRSAFRAISPRTILDDVAIPMQACLDGLRVVFDGRAQAFDQAAAAIEAERRRKVRTLAGNYQLIELMPQLLLPWRNPILLQFVSHKLLRLLAPWALAAALLASAVLAAQGVPLFAGLLAIQLAFYGLALLPWVLPAGRSFRLARVAQAFVALNGFAVLGLFEYLGNREAHLWRKAPTAESGEAR
ncbi:MAG: glycosyltransferase family 2 protein [Rubrivivax sp.]|nr:glycosyltransferase family 2 protein [Rubrivivax sp.]